MPELFQHRKLMKHLVSGTLVVVVGTLSGSRPASADSYQRLSAADCTAADESNQYFDHQVMSTRFSVRNLELSYRNFYCALPMESNLNTNKIKAITAYGYLGHNGNNATSSVDEDISVRPCAYLAGVGGQCANKTYSQTPIGYKPMTIGLSEGGVSNVFANKTGYTAYLLVTLPGVDVGASRMGGFKIEYNP